MQCDRPNYTPISCCPRNNPTDSVCGNPLHDGMVAVIYFRVQHLPVVLNVRLNINIPQEYRN